MRSFVISAVLIAGLLLGLLTGCASPEGQDNSITTTEAVNTDGLPIPLDTQTDESPIRLKVMIAGSLMAPFDELETAYEAIHPEIDVEVEAHGSIQVIRHVTEIGDLVDVVVPADYNLIPMLMYQTPVPESDQMFAKQMFADWYLEFAGNHLALAYTPDSALADQITTENWYEILASPDVRLGLSDPRFDASGYRTMMIAQLAEEYYGEPTIFEKIFAGRFTNTITVKKDQGKSIIHIPEILEPREGSNILMRGSSIALIALLESGEIDYAFEYESVIKQQNLLYIPLPDELNLGDPDLAAQYAAVQVQLDFRRFSTVTPVFDGVPIGYGISIPVNAPHPAEALEFIQFIVGPEGQAIMAESQHPSLEIPWSDNCAAVPAILQDNCLEKTQP